MHHFVRVRFMMIHFIPRTVIESVQYKAAAVT